MKFRVWLVVVACVAAGAGGLTGPRAGLAQDDPFGAAAVHPESGDHAEPLDHPEPADPAEPADHPHDVRIGPGAPQEQRGRLRIERRERHDPWGTTVQVIAQPDSRRAIEALAKKLVEAKDEESKSTAQETLTALLNKYFEADMQHRERELAKVEERLKNLRALLQKRRAKQEEIIDLQIRVLMNEADGLGFFNNASPAGGNPLPMLWQQNSTGGGMGGGGWIGAPTPSVLAPGAPMHSSGGTISIDSSGNVQGVTYPAPAARAQPPKPPRAAVPRRAEAPPADPAAETPPAEEAPL